MSSDRDKVLEFYRAFKQDDFIPVGKPASLGVETISEERLLLKLDLIMEEASELVGAVLGARARKQVEDSWRVARTLDDGERDVVEAADATGDLRYVIAGFDIETNIPSDAVFDEIQASNMSKLDSEGKPIISDGSTGKPVGKILKGEHFFAPDIAGVIDRFNSDLRGE